ncbi:MAG: 30S ribosomal protein S16 [Gammaproteobacteria bacterium]
MVSIRLSRHGTKKRPFYHIVVTDSRKQRDGRYLERVGFFDPLAALSDNSLRIDKERTGYWISKGAKVSERVATLMKHGSAA